MSNSLSRYIIPLALVGILVYVLYTYGGKFFSNIFGDILSGIGGDVGRGITEGAEVGGLTGAVGGGIYETFTGHTETLRERIIERIEVTGEDWTEAGVHEVAEDIHDAPFDTGFIGAILPPFSGFTIGAGVAAIQKWGEWLETLPPEQRRVERWKEYGRRDLWMKEHPIETFFGTPALIYHKLTDPRRDLAEYPTPQLMAETQLPLLGVPIKPTAIEALRIEAAEKAAQTRYYEEVAPTHEPMPEKIVVVIDRTPPDVVKIQPSEPAPKDVIYDPIVRAMGTKEQIAQKYYGG